MFFRYSLALCVVALFSVAIQVSAVESGEDDIAAAGRPNPAAEAVARFIRNLFTDAATSCLTEAAYECKEHWKNPTAAVTCAKVYLKKNKGRCAVGK